MSQSSCSHPPISNRTYVQSRKGLETNNRCANLAKSNSERLASPCVVLRLGGGPSSLGRSSIAQHRSSSHPLKHPDAILSAFSVAH